MIRTLPAAAALLSLATACSAEPDNSVDNADYASVPQTAMEEGAPYNAAGTAPMPVAETSAQMFVDKASGSDLFEIESAKIAQDKGTSTAVKSFAADMVKEHTKSTSDLKKAVSNLSSVEVSPELKSEQDTQLQALRDARENFDHIYARQQIAAHEKALATLRSYSVDGDQPILKDFASKTADVVADHLDMARKLPGASKP